MNESRRKEIEGIIERLEAEKSNLYQIGIADTVAKQEKDQRLERAFNLVREAVSNMRSVIER